MASCSSHLSAESELSIEAKPTFREDSEDSSLLEAESQITKVDSMETTNNTDRFFQRMRTDLMYELRNIQHGERPVTGKNNREQLQQFMEKHMVGTSDISAAAGKNNIPANVDTVEKHRPEAVVVEVQAVVELRPVSSVLQSIAFRRQLENVIRGSLSNRPFANSISVIRNRSNTSLSTGSGGIASNNGRLSLPVIPASVPSPLERPQLTRQDSSESIDSFSSARSSYDQDIDDDFEELEERVTPHGRTSDSAQSRPAVPTVPLMQERVATAPLMQERVATVPLMQERVRGEQPQPPHVSNLWNEITSIQREEIVDEISELLHNRLVSSTLEGEFRSVLELLAQSHISSSGANGRAVQDVINALPRSGVQRNDFSQLGIPAAQENENWDNISVMSVSAHSVPYTQTNTYLGREMQSIKSQMNEMKSMLKLTFDLQMDIQRAIRQEVAAAMNNFVGQGASACEPRPSCPVSDTHCLICLERHTDTVLYQCGHMCVCYVCGRDLMSRGHNCPVCRAPIKDVIRAYKTNAE